VTESVPVLVRVAGLPAALLEPLHSERCLAVFAQLEAAEFQAAECRERLVARLFAVIHGAPPSARRWLLEVKRDVFNGRLGGHRVSPRFSELEDLCGETLAAALLAEDKVVAGRLELELSLEAEASRQVAHLAQVIADSPSLRRGLALAGPVLLRGLLSVSRSDQLPARKRRKLVTSLARYLSRAAIKLSPNSTLTRVGMGALGPPDPRTVWFEPLNWREASRLRIRRKYLDQWCDLLVRAPEFRAGLEVVGNETLEPLESGRCRWVRPGRWVPALDGLGLRFESEAALTARLSDAVTARCAAAGWRWPGATGAEEVGLVRLVDLGLLRLQLPWSTNDRHAEKALLEYVRSLPEGWRDLERCLGRVVDLQAGFATAEAPEDAVEALGKAMAEVSTAVAERVGVEWYVTSEYRRGRLYEDVVLLGEGPIGPALARVSSTAIERAVASTLPLVELAYLYNHRHDFLCSVQALAARELSHRPVLGFVEFFHWAQPLFRQYQGFLNQKSPDRWRATFNPFDVAQLSELQGLRDAVWAELPLLVSRRDEADVLSSLDLAAMLSRVPTCYRPLVGPSLFLQLVESSSELWMLNRLHEGTGRYGSRFTPVMEEVTRGHYVRHLRNRSEIRVDGVPVELLDLLCPAGDTLNVHELQTARFVDLDGSGCDPAPERRLRLKDLRVELSGPLDFPWLIDSAGRRLLPLHLGGASHAYLPPMAQFLCLLGPGEFRSVWPPRTTRDCGDGSVQPRLQVDSLILGRRRWTFPSQLLKETWQGSDADAYMAVQRWRSKHGLPTKMFALERILHVRLGERTKPQFVDLSSPLCLSVLRPILESAGESLSFEEMLPGFEHLPRDRHGAPWALEVLFDSCVLLPRVSLASKGVGRDLSVDASKISNFSLPEPVAAHH
jgi:Lantibiotic dehydratase, N terminus